MMSSSGLETSTIGYQWEEKRYVISPFIWIVLQFTVCHDDKRIVKHRNHWSEKCKVFFCFQVKRAVRSNQIDLIVGGDQLTAQKQAGMVSQI